MKKGRFFVVVLLLAASSIIAKNPGPVTGVEGLDELKKEKGLFKTTLINPDVDFSSYSQLWPNGVLLQFHSSGLRHDAALAGSLVRRRNRTAEIPEGEDLETFRQVINDAVVGELGSSERIKLVDDGGPQTLIVRAMVTDIVTDIASKSGKSGQDPKPFSVQGDITFDLLDAETGVILARVSERRKSRKTGDSVKPPDAGAEWADIWVWAEQAGADLRQELERVLNEDRG